MPMDHDTLIIGDCNVGTWKQEVYCAHRLFQVATGLDEMKKTKFKRPSGWTGKRLIVIAGTFDIIRGDPREIVDRNLREFTETIRKSLRPEKVYVISPFEVHELAQRMGDGTHLNGTGYEQLVTGHPEIFVSASLAKEEEARFLATVNDNDLPGLTKAKRYVSYLFGKSPVSSNDRNESYFSE